MNLTQKSQNKAIIKKLLEKLIPKYGIAGTAREISKEGVSISTETIRKWTIAAGIKYPDREEAKILFSEKKTRELIEKLDELSKKNE